MSIKLIFEPKVYLIGSQVVNEVELSDFLAANGAPDWTTDAGSAGEKLAECSGRLCYHSFAKPRPGGNAGYLRHILEVGHGSVLEHSVYTLIFTGISRSCSHELVRHRHLSPSQLSQRFVDESDCAFVVPPAVLPDSWAFHVWEQQCKAAVTAYCELADEIAKDVTVAAWRAAGAPQKPDRDWEWQDVDHALEWAAESLSRDGQTARRKAAREAARSVLPNATETRMCLTGNARAWRGFIDQRARPEADAEIRRLALAIHAKLAAVSPNLFGDYQPDPAGGLTTPYRKV